MAKNKKQSTPETVSIPIEKLEINRGQYYGLPKNPRLIRDARFDALKKSITDDPEMLNLRELIVYPLDNGNYLVIGGNMRLRACTELGFEELPCKVIPAETPVAKLRAYVVKDNVGFGENDWDAFANDWDPEELIRCGLELDDINLDGDEEEVEEDEVPDEVETRCKKGEIWQLGEHRLMCGDSTDIESVKKLTGGCLIDLLFTDPPYNVDYSAKEEHLKKSGHRNASHRAIVNDAFESDEELGEKVLVPAFENARAVAAKHCSVYACFAAGDKLVNLYTCLTKTGWKIRHSLVWAKNAPVLCRCDYNYQHEAILFGWNENHKFYGDGKLKSTVWNIPKPQKSELHPTMKPIELVANAILNSSKKGDAVLDLFGGSGSTLIAAEQTGRKAFLMEFEEYYCDVIITRWEQLTGQKAVLADA